MTHEHHIASLIESVMKGMVVNVHEHGSSAKAVIAISIDEYSKFVDKLGV